MERELRFVVRSAEFAWAAGLFEGEGSLSRNPQEGRRGRAKWVLAVGMTDQDVVERFHAAVGGLGAVRGPYVSRKDGVLHKPTWQWSCAKRAHVYALAAALYPNLGERRQAKFREALAELPPVQSVCTECGGRAHARMCVKREAA